MDSGHERSALKLSIAGSSFFGMLGIAFAVYTGSQAVLLDGAFNIVAAVMAFVGLKIAASLQTPESEHYPIGFYALESLFILTKGLILFLLTSYVIFNNIIIMVNGGSELNLGMVLVYLSVALTGNAVVYLLIKKKQLLTTSQIVNIEKESWKVNTAITASILVAILISYLLQDSFLKDYVRYIDQVIVIIVALIAMPVPVKSIRGGLRELLLFAPGDDVREKVQEVIDRETTAFKNVIFKNNIMLKTGRKVWVTLLVYSNEKTLPTQLSDQIRQQVSRGLLSTFQDHNVDVIITDQPAI